MLLLALIAALFVGTDASAKSQLLAVLARHLLAQLVPELRLGQVEILLPYGLTGGVVCADRAAATQLATLLCTACRRSAVSPIFKAAMEVFEAHILAMHKQQWAASAAAAAGLDGPDSEAAGLMAVTETSRYVADLANAIAVFRYAGGHRLCARAMLCLQDDEQVRFCCRFSRSCSSNSLVQWAVTTCKG